MGDTVKNMMVHVLGDLIQKEVHVAPMLDRLVQVMTSQLQADRGTVFLLNETRQELVSVAAHLPEIREIRVPISQGVAGYVARTGNIVNIPTHPQSVPIWRDIDRQTGYHTRSILAGPLFTQDHQLLGVAQLLNKKTGEFTEHDEALFQTLCLQASLLLEQTTVSHIANYLPAESTPSDMSTSLGEELPLGDRFNLVIGSSDPIRRVLRMIRRVAPTDATVLLRGNTGTGKGMFARTIHHNSPRHEHPFVTVDCTTLPEGLVESELFGHEQGAFTGANQRKQGKVEKAQDGTLFLDEIGDLPLSLQGKLLTLLQEHTYYRLGSNTPKQANIRILAATNRSLETLVQQGLFREDLYFRLRVVEITLPSLQERGPHDLLRLINYFVDRAAQRHRKNLGPIDPTALAILLSYPWPGNVRELEHCIESAVIFADDKITTDCLSLPRHPLPSSTPPIPPHHSPSLPSSLPHPPSFPPPWMGGTNTSSFSHPSHPPEPTPLHPSPDPTTPPFSFSSLQEQPSLAQLEVQYIQYTLQRCQGNRSLCARILGIGRNTLLRKLKEIEHITS